MCQHQQNVKYRFGELLRHDKALRAFLSVLVELLVWLTKTELLLLLFLLLPC